MAKMRCLQQHLASLKGDTIKAIIPGLPRGRRGRGLLRLAGDGLRFPGLGTVCALHAGTGGRVSEFMFIGIVASGGNPLAAATAGLLVNARHVPFGVTVRELVGQRAAEFSRLPHHERRKRGVWPVAKNPRTA